LGSSLGHAWAWAPIRPLKPIEGGTSMLANVLGK